MEYIRFFQIETKHMAFSGIFLVLKYFLEYNVILFIKLSLKLMGIIVISLEFLFLSWLCLSLSDLDTVFFFFKKQSSPWNANSVS